MTVHKASERIIKENIVRKKTAADETLKQLFFIIVSVFIADMMNSFPLKDDLEK